MNFLGGIMYKGQEYNVFISYRGNRTGELGASIYKDLLHYMNADKKNEFSPFFAPLCIPKGEDFKKAIASVLEDVKCFILLLDKDYFRNCTKDDDMVFFELQTALQNPNISFVPVALPDFSYDNQPELLSCFETSEINRIRHINQVNYLGVYNFKAEIDLIPVILSTLKSTHNQSNSSAIFNLDINEFRTVNDKKFTFGIYPQAVVSDLELIEKIATGMFSGETSLNPNTYTLQFRGKAFATIAENPFNKTKFDNGKVINAGARNYYELSPIVWQVLFENDNYYFAITEKIIDAVQFSLNRFPQRLDNKFCQANSWETSYVRRWLNNEFFYDAFNETEREQIVYVKIDNTNSGYYPSTSEDTNDKVFLISHNEIYRTDCSGALTTDYAKARGAYSSTSASHYGKGDWWTRSPGLTNDSVENVDRRGCVNAVPFCNYVDDTAASLRPCILIKKQ